MSKNKIQFEHNIKKIKEKREFNRWLKLERQTEEQNYITSNFGKVNTF